MTVSKSRKNRGQTIKSKSKPPKTIKSRKTQIKTTRTKSPEKTQTNVSEHPTIMEEIHTIFGVLPEINEEEHQYTIRDPRNKKCITLHLDSVSKKIKIVIVNKCDLYSGKESLEKVIQLANKINYNDIILEDFSHLQFTGKSWGTGIKLAPLFIMIRGKSWYNGYGFVSDNYENEIKQNSHLSSSKMGDLLEKIYPHGVPSSIPPSLYKELNYSEDQTLSEFMSNFLSYTGKIKKEDGTIPATNVIVKWVSNLVILISYKFIVYDYNLHYDPSAL